MPRLTTAGLVLLSISQSKDRGLPRKVRASISDEGGEMRRTDSDRAPRAPGPAEGDGGGDPVVAKRYSKRQTRRTSDGHPTDIPRTRADMKEHAPGHSSDLICDSSAWRRGRRRQTRRRSSGPGRQGQFFSWALLLSDCDAARVRMAGGDTPGNLSRATSGSGRERGAMYVRAPSKVRGPEVSSVWQR